MLFEASARPFKLWSGPYSPARGNASGFRIRGKRLGVFVNRDDAQEFWTVEPSVGVDALIELVSRHWTGGRILLLPSGLVIKPMQNESEAGKRVVLGRLSGRLMLQRPDGNRFDMAAPPNLVPGGRWPGPSTTGLECSRDHQGKLICKWDLPIDGEDWDTKRRMRKELRGADGFLAAGLRKARPGETGNCRVRLTFHGHITTNKELPGNVWEPRYVGHVDPGSLRFLDQP